MTNPPHRRQLGPVLDAFQALLPRPGRAQVSSGHCRLTTDMPIAGAHSPLAGAMLRSLLSELLNDPIPGIPSNTTEDTRVLLTDGAEGHAPGAYTLRVSPTQVEITAGGTEGVAHALTTLRQLLPDAVHRRAAGPPPEGWRVPCGVVEDEPVFAWRGAMLDVTRHFFPKRTVLRYVDLLAAHRFNRLHLHLSDDQGWRVESRRHPELHTTGSWRTSTRLGPGGPDDGTPHGGYYTLDDLAEIAGYARLRGITLVPEIDVPGHTSALRAAAPLLGRPGEPQAVLDTVWEGGTSVAPVARTEAYLCDVLEEIIEATGAPYVHLGGDECAMDWWAEDPEVAAAMAAAGCTEPREMHGHFLRSLGRFLAGLGVRMIVWDEGHVTGGVLPDTIVMAWRGDEASGRAAATHDVVRSPLFPTYFNFDQSDLDAERRSEGGPITLTDVARFAPAPTAWSEEQRAHVLGGQFQIWTEWVPDERHLDYLAFPRACALAEVLWSGGVPDPADFDARLVRHLRRLDAMGVEYRPLAGPHPWQTGGTGVWKRSSPGRIAETRKWLDSISNQP
ncbi:beta-N-acetylhexosaminidase [Streptomyces sp. NPDC093544]|uniref:beta-N-acetylhexosaminidase n=1 Tax=Streptomyces sp. NPDC093544 TaxID=3155200 RepID=UPI003446392F